MQEYDDADLEIYVQDSLRLPLLRLTTGGPPHVEIRVGDQGYRYERSYPIKGHSAVMPQYLREQSSAGKRPLIVERPDRYYVYFAV